MMSATLNQMPFISDLGEFEMKTEFMVMETFLSRYFFFPFNASDLYADMLHVHHTSLIP